jgi:hypothetical protein
MIGSETSYWLIGASSDHERPVVAIFRQWLFDEVSKFDPTLTQLAVSKTRLPTVPERLTCADFLQ